jgi:hypothetical protein
VQGETDIMPNQLETRKAHCLSKIGFAPGEKVVDTNDRLATRKQGIAKMGADKTGASGDQDRFIFHGEFDLSC